MVFVQDNLEQKSLLERTIEEEQIESTNQGLKRKW